jgi:hypothetical protein
MPASSLATDTAALPAVVLAFCSPEADRSFAPSDSTVRVSAPLIGTPLAPALATQITADHTTTSADIRMARITLADLKKPRFRAFTLGRPIHPADKIKINT